MKLDENDVIIELRGNRRCFVEGVSALAEYGEELIAAKVKNSGVTIRGSGLKLFLLSNDRLGVSGNIDSVSFGGAEGDAENGR